MSGEGQLATGGEDPHPDVCLGSWRQQKDGLGEIHLARELLHLL